MDTGADRDRQSRVDEVLARIKSELFKQSWQTDLSLKGNLLQVGAVRVHIDDFERDFDEAMVNLIELLRRDPPFRVRPGWTQPYRFVGGLPDEGFGPDGRHIVDKSS
jgi:hypothetical protein